MTEPKKRKKLGKLYFNLCKTLNDCFCGRSSYPFNTFSIYFLIAAAIALPIATGQAYFQSGWHIAIEIIFILFYLGFLSCTILFYRKSIWHWCVAVILLVHYVSLADVIIKNSSEFNILYLGFVGVFFISYASWKSAKDVNRKGGLIDTIVLAIGIAGCVIGLIMLQEQVQYAKVFVIAGVALIYIYAIARSLFWLVYTQERIKLSLIKTMFYVVFYLVLIMGLPFFLLWTGVEESILQNVIIPIYASVLGGALALAGVAWTIRFTKNERVEQDKKRDEERREEERKKYRPVFNIYHGEYRSFVDAYFKDFNGIHEIGYGYLGSINREHRSFLDAHFEDFNGIHGIGYGYLGSINREHQVIIEDFILENSCFTEFYIRGVKINNKQYDRDRNLFIKKEAYVQFDLDHMPLHLSETFQTITLIVEDLLGNVYEVPLDTEIELKDGIRHVEIKGSRRIKI